MAIHVPSQSLPATLSAERKERLKVEKIRSCSFRKQHYKEDDIVAQITVTLNRNATKRATIQEVIASG